MRIFQDASRASGLFGVSDIIVHWFLFMLVFLHVCAYSWRCAQGWFLFRAMHFLILAHLSHMVRIRPPLKRCIHFGGGPSFTTVSPLDLVQWKATRLVGYPYITSTLQSLSCRWAVALLSFFYREFNFLDLISFDISCFQEIGIAMRLHFILLIFLSRRLPVV